MNISKKIIYILSGVLGICSIFVVMIPKFLVVIILSAILIVIPNLTSISEDFTFEVSPERMTCMKENVSLEQPPTVRSDICCNVTERGAKLNNIEDWKKEGWARTDNYVNSTDHNCFKTQVPPTVLV
jgi:hypothetical protein